MKQFNNEVSSPEPGVQSPKFGSRNHSRNRHCEALASASRGNLFCSKSPKGHFQAMGFTLNLKPFALYLSTLLSALAFPQGMPLAQLWSFGSKTFNLKPFAFYLTLVFLLSALSSSAQIYPVQVTPVLVPPYSLNTSDYYNGTTERLAIVLTNTDLQKPVLSVRLRMYIEGQNAKLQTHLV